MAIELPKIEKKKWERGVPILDLKETYNNGKSVEVDCLVNELSISRLAARVLNARGHGAITFAQEFLSPSLKEHLPDPKKIKNIIEVAKIIIEHLEQKKRILVYSDFDVDGLTSGSQLVGFLKELGCDAYPYVPNRFEEGYGLVMSAVEKIKVLAPDLVITVDCGITSFKEIEKLKAYGIDTVVIDHHEVPEILPPALSIVDPMQEGCPFKKYKMCAAGLVWMLLVVIRSELKGKREAPDPKKYLPLAGLGTICDMVPLLGVNRILALRGLEAFRKTDSVGLIALREVSGITDPAKLNSTHIGFMIGPRINAAGRLGDATKVVDLFTTSNPVLARKIANELNASNTKRKDEEEQVRLDCLKLAENSVIDGAVVLMGTDYHIGVIGIVAQKMVEHFSLPAAIFGSAMTEVNGKIQEVYKGSIRSVKGFNISDALKNLSSSIISGGGHAEAGGVTLLPEKFQEFKKGFSELAKQTLGINLGRRYVSADCQIELEELDLTVVNELMRFGPFGVGNPTPTFYATGIKVEEVQGIGENHLKFKLSDGKRGITTLAWGQKDNPLLRNGTTINAVFGAEINQYNGNSSVQLVLKESWE